MPDSRERGHQGFVLLNRLKHGVQIEAHSFTEAPHGQARIKLLYGEGRYLNFELWLPLADAFLQNLFAGR